MKLKQFTALVCFLPLIFINAGLPHKTFISALISLIWCAISGYYYAKFIFKNFEL